MTALVPIPVLRLYDNSGNLAIGGQVYTYAAGTSTPQATYTDSSQTVPNTNPVIANSRGEVTIWLGTGLLYKLVAKDAAGNTLWTVDQVAGGDYAAGVAIAGLRADLADPVTSGKGTSLLGWIRAATSAVATTLKSWLGWQEINAFEFMTVAQIADFQSGAQTLDLAAPLQAWVNACVAAGLVGRFPKGGARIGTPLQVNGPVVLRGSGVTSGLLVWGCDGFVINTDHVRIEDMGLFSYSSSGTGDPRLYTGITGAGTAVTNRNYLRHTGLYMQGWNRAISWKYTWLSQAERVVVVNSNYGIHLFGQSVNNHITDCDLITNSGTAAIHMQKDGAIQGEGLFVSGTLMASGQNAMLSDGFLSVGVDPSCMADLIQGKAFNFSGVTVFKCEAQWVYSNDTCFYAADQSSMQQTDWDISVGRATCAGSANLVYWGSNNNGLKLGGNLYLPTGGGYPVSLNGGMADIYSTITNGTVQKAVRVNTGGNTIRTTGDRSVEWATTPVTTVGNALALTLPRNGCPVFSVVGATNITSIDTSSWDGQTVKLIFTSALTVVKGSNLKINSNFVTTADDSLTLTCVGANWYEDSRSVN